MEAKSKAQTYIGFAVRANKYRTGLNSVESLKKAELIIVCKTASENSKSQARKIAEKLCCNIFVTEKHTLSELVFKENVKIMAITDKNLSDAIKKNSEGELTIFNRENIYG